MANSSRRTNSVASHSSRETVDILKATVVQLRYEIEDERKCARRLRREKAYEVQLAREQEQTKAAVSFKELAAKLQQEKEQELDALSFKFKTDVGKVAKQKDKEVKKVRKDLARCQEELKEEVFKCGLSTSARATFELERLKLLQEIKELSASKKQVEDALHTAAEAEKLRTQELRQLQETSRNEISKLNKQANIEVKRLLEQLKAKDHLVPTAKSSLSAARPLTKRQPEVSSDCVGDLVNLSQEIETWKQKLSVIDEVTNLIKSGGNLPNLNLQRKLYEVEKQLKLIVGASNGFTEKNNELMDINKMLEQKVVALQEQNSTLNKEIKTAKDEAKHLKDLAFSTSFSNSPKSLLQNSSQIKGNTEKKKAKVKKTVRFLLPDEEHEVYAGSDDIWYDDGGGGGGGKVSKGGGDGADTEADTQRQILQLFKATTSNIVDSNKDEWKAQKESLQVVIQALEEKLHHCEDNEDKLKLKLKEVCDQNEELEFQILELENGTDERKLQWQRENEMLRSELSTLKNQISHGDITERNVAVQCSEELLAKEFSKMQRLYHKLTDDYKIPGEKNEKCQNEATGCSVLKTHDFCNLETDASTDGRRKDSEFLSQIESLKRKLSRSQGREQEMKDQLLLLEEEKNRHIRLLQQQIESLEGESDCSSLELMVCCDGEDKNQEMTELDANVVRLKLDTTLNWIPSPSDALSLTPSSGDINIRPSFDYKDLREEMLNQQISDLERDRDVLQEILHNNESVIDELQSKVSKLLQSERDLQQIVIRLENAEELMRYRADDMVSQNYDMENQLLRLKESESILLLDLKKTRLSEYELKMRLDELMEEKYCCENAWRRRLSEVEVEKKVLIGKAKELEEQIADLESGEILLRQKVKKMEKTESFLRNELEEMRRENNVMSCQISDLEIEKQFLIQKLEKTNFDFMGELIHLKQEKEAMQVEMIEMNCTIKVLKQCLASRDATILSLESKLHELELYEKELWRHIQEQFNLNTNEHQIQNTNPGSNDFQDASRFVNFNNTCKDCYPMMPENDTSTSDNHLSKESTSWPSVMSSGIDNPTDELGSADEASEILDEDDGASLHADPSTSCTDDCKLSLTCSISKSPSLDSINCDSGLDSMRQDISHRTHRDTPICQEIFSQVKRPVVYRPGYQSSKSSLIPVSTRYMTLIPQKHFESQTDYNKP